MIKLFTAVAVVLSLIMYWATTNVCRYNFAIDKKTNMLNIVSEEIKPSLGYTEVYYFHELNCNDVNFNFSIERLHKNIRAISVMVYQQLTTNIVRSSF